MQCDIDILTKLKNPVLSNMSNWEDCFPTARPSIFVGSSREGLDIAKAVEFNLKDDADVTIWNQNVFELSHATLESLVKLIDQFDFAVLVLTPDDILVSRHNVFETARDNVFVELGLFMGKLGRERTFVVCDQDSEVKIPSDLSGVTLAGYHGKRKDKNMVSALSPACTQIKLSLNLVDVKNPVHPVGKIPESLSFDCMSKEYDETLSLLESNNAGVLQQIKSRGDFIRLVDGLFNGLLFVSRAIVTGFVDPIIYGNMMEFEQKSESLRVKYFAGPYNEEIICRYFPIKGMNRGVAGVAFSSNKLLIENCMENILRVKGEGRLKSMMSIPIESPDNCLGKTVVVLNVDAAVENAFPSEDSEEFPSIKKRIGEIIKLVQRVNKIAQESDFGRDNLSP
jgi:predicted nucleotide-binding protein